MSSRVGAEVGAAVVVLAPLDDLDVLGEGEDPLFFFSRAEYSVPSPRCRRRRVMRPRRRSGKLEDATSMSIVVVGAMVGTFSLPLGLLLPPLPEPPLLVSLAGVVDLGLLLPFPTTVEGGTVAAFATASTVERRSTVDGFMSFEVCFSFGFV